MFIFPDTIGGHVCFPSFCPSLSMHGRRKSMGIEGWKYTCNMMYIFPDTIGGHVCFPFLCPSLSVHGRRKRMGIKGWKYNVI